MSSSVPVGALVGWMLVLTFKHIIADFVLQNAWMAYGKDQKKGWALPLLVHCLIDFLIHIVVDRAKGLCSSTFGMTPEHPWFWTLIGVDQALHHLTGFGLSIFMAANA